MIKTFFSIAIVGLLLASSLFVFPVSSLTIKSTSTNTILFVDDDFNETTPGYNITNFSKIQYAIDNASSGDTVFVYNGIYTENLIINSSISLIGEKRDSTIINGTSDEIIKIKKDNVKISGFFIRRLRLTSYTHSTDIKVRGNNTVIDNNKLYRAHVYLNKYDSITISNNNHTHAHIFLRDSKNNIVYHNYMYSCYIALSNSSDSEFNNNIVDGAGDYAGLVVKSKNVKIKNNIIKNYFLGIIMESTGNEILNNDFYDNTYSYGVWYFGRNKIRHNYWLRPRVLPKFMFKIHGGGPFSMYVGFSCAIDWFPAKVPNNKDWSVNQLNG